MCDSVTCIHADQRAGSSLTATAGTALATLAVAALVALTYRAMTYVWPLALTAYALACAYVWAPRPTRAVLRALRRVVAWAWRRWVRKPAPAAAWSATVALTGPDGTVQSLTRSVPAGELAATTAAGAAEEIRARLAEQFGAQQAISCRVEALR